MTGTRSWGGKAAGRYGLLLALALAMAIPSVRAQQPATAPAPTASAPQIAPPALKGSQADTRSNTTVIARPTLDNRTGAELMLSAFVTEDSPPLDRGVVWRIFRDQPGPDGKLRLLSQHKDASPQLRLEVGTYLVNVAYGRANLTRKVSVAAGKVNAEKFVIAAGGLRVAALISSGEAAAENSIAYSILSDERDQFGNRIPVMSGARPGVVIRLNAGTYQLVSVYGDANAAVRAEVTVEPGKITEATLTHSAGRVTFRLVGRAGGEALADTQWNITNAQGDVVKESVGAIPTHTLAPGTYVATARRQGLTFKRDFSLQAGDNVYVEVVANP